MKHYFVLGRKLSHSLSPFFHNNLFKSSNMDADYSLLEFEPKGAAQVFSRLRQEAAGFNITVPYKQLCMDYIDEISPEALKAGAVNTVVNDNGKLIGYNTDGKGFLMAIGDLSAQLKDKQVLLLGAGGVATILAIELLQCGAFVKLFDITEGKALELLQVLKQFPAGVRAEILEKPIAGAYLVVNATPVGMFPNVNASPLEQKDFAGVKFAFDCVYNPLQTRFLQWAQEAGANGIEGLSMLWYQGLEAQRLWGNYFEQSVLNEAYEKLKIKAGERQ